MGERVCWCVLAVGSGGLVSPAGALFRHQHQQNMPSCLRCVRRHLYIRHSNQTAHPVSCRKPSGSQTGCAG